MYPLDFHYIAQPFRARRVRGDYDERERQSFRTRELRRDRRSVFRRFVHGIVGLCFR